MLSKGIKKDCLKIWNAPSKYIRVMMKWKDLTTLVRVEASREIKGVLSQETRYYISDENINKASYYQDLARGHWGIENHLHWHLDVTFKEDMCRARTGNAPENLTTIRKLHILSQLTDLSFNGFFYLEIERR